MKRLLQQVLFFWRNEEFVRSKEMRRKYFLGLFILISFCVIFYLLILNLVQWFTTPNALSGPLVATDLILLIGLLAMFMASNTVYSKPIAYVLLIASSLAITFLFPRTSYENVLIMYALPTLAASFLIREWASFPLALFSIIIYVIRQYLSGTPEDISHSFIGGIMIVASVSWYVATRLEFAMLAISRSEQKYQSLADQNPLCVYELEGGRSGKWIYVNSKIENLLGYSAQEWLTQPELWLRSINPRDRERVTASFHANSQGSTAYTEEYSLVRKDGRSIFVQDTYSLAIEPGKSPLVQGVLVDITRRKRAELAQAAIYRISQAADTVETPDELYPMIHAALGAMMPVNNFYIALYDPSKDLIHFPYFVDEVDSNPGHLPPGRGLTEYVLRQGQPLYAPLNIFQHLVDLGEVETIGAPSVDWLGVPLKVRERTIGVMAVQSYTAEQHFEPDDLEMLTFVSTQVAMVIERKHAEAALHYSENIYHTTIDSLDEYIQVVDADLRLVMVNQSYRSFNVQFGGPETLEGCDLKEAVPFVMTRELLKTYRKILQSGQRQTLIDRFKIGKQELILEVRLVPVIENGKVDRIITLARDITDQKKAEDQIKEALREKEVLLREVHHRVKNNLQVMSSLISLETDYVKDPQAQRLFFETQSRVRTMALIHEELYQSQNLAQVNFADYINKLANNLMQIYRIHHNVSLKVEIGDMLLGVDTAIPCGLIVNELMTNALKYAFPNNRPGEISISLTSVSEKGRPPRYQLCVQDDGIGLPPDFDMKTTTTLGLQLVLILISQLKGKIEISSDKGTRFILTFHDQSAGQASHEKVTGEQQ